MGVQPDSNPISRERPPRTGDGLQLAMRAAELVREKKGDDLVLLDLRTVSAVSDFFLLTSAQSEVQAKAIAEHLTKTLGEEGNRPWHVEGMENRRWVLLDFVDVVVHVFHQETRSYYLLERLWGDAKRIDLPEE